MTTPPRTRLAALTALLPALLVTVALSACTPEEPVDPAAELAARPTYEHMIDRYTQMQQQIRDRLDAEFGPFTWQQFDDGNIGGLCGNDFPYQFGGKSGSLPLWGFDGVIPDTDWPRARQIITETITEYGFVPAGLQLDEPGHHILNAFDTTLGAHFSYGSQINTTTRTRPGCHLPEAIHPNPS